MQNCTILWHPQLRWTLLPSHGPSLWTPWLTTSQQPNIVPWHRGTKPPPCFALAQHPLFSIHPGPHPCIHIPLPHLLSSAALSFITFLCTVRCREEERDGGRDKGKERGLLLAFRWFHMKSQGTHLGCRHRWPASHLLPLGLPWLEFGCPCTARACTDKDRHICELILLEAHQCVRWVDCMATLFLLTLNGFLLLQEEASVGLRCSCVCVLFPALSSECQVSGSYLSLCLQGCRFFG